MNKIREIIYNNIDPWTEQRPDATKDEIFRDICYGLDNGLLYAVEDNGFVMLFQHENRYLCRVHLYSDSTSFKIVKSVHKIMKHIFDNTNMQKVYGMFENKKIGSLAVRTGWKFHGEITEATMTKDSGMQSLYIYGISRKDFYEQCEEINEKSTRDR